MRYQAFKWYQQPRAETKGLAGSAESLWFLFGLKRQKNRFEYKAEIVWIDLFT